MKITQIPHRRKFLVLSAASCFTVPSFAGGMSGGATEATQIRNEIELVLQYATQVEQYIIQGKQLAAAIQDLKNNPFSLLGPEIGGLINGVGKLMKAGQSIGSNLADMNKRFADAFKNPTAATLAANFTKWHHTSTDTLEGALKAAGMHSELIEDETVKIKRLFDKAKDAGGNLAALNTLSEINIAQMEQMQQLRSLIATQNIAASTYMASQTARDQAKHKAGEINFKAEPLPDKRTFKNPTF